MSRFIVATALIAGIGSLGTAGAHEENNEVRCGGTQVRESHYWVSYDFLEGDGSGRTIEGCGDDGAPVQGRIYVTDENGGGVAADGENDTPGAKGWVRVNGDGSVTCYDTSHEGGDPDSKKNQGNFRNLDCLFIVIQ